MAKNSKNIFTALDIANFYIRLANAIPDDSIDNLKLNKLLYFAQGWALSEMGTPLFADEIQAWNYGPVIPSVYHTFKCCGRDNIQSPSSEFDESKLNTEQLNLLIDVYVNYGKYTGVALKNMTHLPNTPWSRVYEHGANNIIPHEMMKEYFDNDTSFRRFDDVMKEIPVITAVPADWDSEEDAAYDI